MSENCPVCQTACGRMNAEGNCFAYECPRCGNFVLYYHNNADLQRTFVYAKADGEEDKKRAIVSHAIREMQEEDAWPTLKGDLIEAILNRSLPTISEQIDIFIRWVGDNIKVGDYVRVNSFSILAIIGAITLKEFYLILGHLQKKGLIESETVVGGGDIDIVAVTLSFEGLEYYEELKSGDNDKKKEGDNMPSIMETQEMIKIFISHSSTDQQLAEKLTELVKNALRLSSDEIRCTTIDGYRLPGGAKTNEQIKREVRDSIAFIGLISTAATDSMYVLFELGARWGSDKHLLPLLAPGVSPDILKGPLSDLNALSCGNVAQLHQLVKDLADTLDVQPETPDAYQRYIDGILAISPSVDKSPSGSDQVEVPPGCKLTDVQIRILEAVADMNDREATVAKIVRVVGLSDMEAKYNLDELNRKHELLDWVGSMIPNVPDFYTLTHKGRGLVLSRRDS
jgi:hypothetical protein